MYPKRIQNTLFITFLFSFASCIGWGDMLDSRTKIVGDYYLVEGDDGFFIGFKVDDYDDYSYRVPEHVIAYGIADSFLVAKSKLPTVDSVRYYIINMQRDSEYADSSSYLVGIKGEQEFKNEWSKKVTIKFTKVD
jgi:hypothetical protein